MKNATLTRQFDQIFDDRLNISASQFESCGCDSYHGSSFLHPVCTLQLPIFKFSGDRAIEKETKNNLRKFLTLKWTKYE